MTGLSIPKERLLRDLGVSASEELWETITMMGTPIDEQTPEGIVVDITPNRPDLLSYAGFLRALRAFLGKETGLRSYETTPSKLKVTVDENLKGIRPATACAVVRGLEIDEEFLKEIIDIQEKLHGTFGRRRKRCAIGVYPLEAIKGNITFTAKRPEHIRFRPLESDREMTAAEILADHPKGREYAPLLAGLPAYPVFLDSKGNVLSMPPIINSHDVGKVTEQTKEVFIEASGHDFRVCHEAIRIICCALADHGAQIQTVQVAYGRKIEVTPDLSPSRQEFYGYYVNRRLGISLSPDDFAPLLGKMGLGCEKARIKDTYHAIIPPYRVDFLHQVDVVEDLAIAYGYNRIVADLPKLGTVAWESPRTILARTVRKVLTGHGLMEAKNYHLASETLQRDLGHASIATLASSVSLEYDSLRASLLVSLLGTLATNRVHAYPQAFFEIGTVFSPGPRRVDEAQHLGMALAGNADYTRIRQVVESLLAGLGIKSECSPADDARFMRGRCAQVMSGDVRLGVIGELAPQVITRGGVGVPVAAAEIDLDAVLRML